MLNLPEQNPNNDRIVNDKGITNKHQSKKIFDINKMSKCLSVMIIIMVLMLSYIPVSLAQDVTGISNSSRVSSIDNGSADSYLLGSSDTSGVQSESVSNNLNLSYDMGQIGSTLTDLSGKGNNGVVHGTEYVTLSNGVGIRHFSGSDYVIAPDSVSLNPTSGLSIDTLFKLDQLNHNHALVSKSWSGETGSGYTLMIDEYNNIEFIVYNATGYKVTLRVNPSLTIGQWYHLVATDDGANLALYLNGNLIGTAPCLGIKPSNSINDLTIGRYSPIDDYFLIGSLATVKIYGNALNASEVQQNYNYEYYQLFTHNVGFTQPSYNYSKTVGTINIPVTLLYTNNLENYTVDYHTIDDSATSAVNFIGSSGTLTYAPGEKSKNISIQIINDGTIWPSRKQFYIQLSNPSNNVYLGNYNNITVSIGNNGGIALSFDDNRVVNWYSYRWLFQQYNAKATFDVNGIEGYNSTELYDLDMLYQDGHEIASHSMNHADSIVYLQNHTVQQWLNSEIIPAINQLNARGYNVESFAYPDSHSNDTTDAALKLYFRTLRTATWGSPINSTIAYYNWDNVQTLSGIEIDESANYSINDIKSGMDKANNDGTVLILYGHQIVDNVSGIYQTSSGRLASIMQYANDHNMTYYHMKDLNGGIQITYPVQPTSTPLPHTDPLPNMNGLVLWYDMNDTGSMLTDYSGNGNDGAIYGTDNVTLANGVNVLHFNGSDYINGGNSVSLDNATGLTIEAVFKLDDLTGQQMIISKSGTSGSSTGYSMMLTDGRLEVDIFDGTQSKVMFYPAQSLVAGVWYDAVLTADGSNATLYLNKVKLLTKTCIGLSPSYYDLTIGKYTIYDNYHFSGSIATVRVYDRALSDSEVSQNDNNIWYINVPAKYSVNEWDGTLSLPINLSLDSTTPVTVHWSTKNGSAVAGTDYTANSGTITYQPGETNKYVTIQILNDHQMLGDKVFYVDLSMPNGASINNSESAVTIKDALSETQGPNAAYINDTIPDTMEIGQTYAVSVTMQNDGTTSWSEANLDRLLFWGNTSTIGIIGDCDNHSCGYPEYAIQNGTIVNPGDLYTWYFNITPTIPGTYSLSYSLANNGAGSTVTGFGTAGFASIYVPPFELTQANAEVVGSNIPGTVMLGHTYNASITLKNTGSNSWNEGYLVRMLVWGSTAELGISGNANNYGCGYEEFAVPVGTTVSPGESHTWNFTFTPNTAGYTCIGLIMAHNGEGSSVTGFGLAEYKSIIVTPATFDISLGNAWYQSNTVPTLMVAGQTYNVSVTYMNNGWAPWSEMDQVRMLAFGDTTQLGLTGDVDNHGSGFPEYGIPSGNYTLLWQIHTYNFTFTPTTAGTYMVGFAMVQNQGASVSPFGGYGYADVTVIPSTFDMGRANAEYVNDTIPTSMTSGHTYNVSITYRNTGTCLWSEADLSRMLAWGDTTRMGVNGDCNNLGCGYPEYAIVAGTQVLPGQEYTWNFTITPTGTGVYGLGFTMAKNGAGTSITGFGNPKYSTITVT
jgi:peptidoglycan/xylan/chitin deacetylase (PgdA/CDA1 family)